MDVWNLSAISPPEGNSRSLLAAHHQTSTPTPSASGLNSLDSSYDYLTSACDLSPIDQSMSHHYRGSPDGTAAPSTASFATSGDTYQSLQYYPDYESIPQASSFMHHQASRANIIDNKSTASSSQSCGVIRSCVGQFGSSAQTTFAYGSSPSASLDSSQLDSSSSSSKSPLATPMPNVPVSVRIGLLQMRFMEKEKSHRTQMLELQTSYHMQSSQMESERYQSLQRLGAAPWMHQRINAYYDYQHHGLIDCMEKSLDILSHRPSHNRQIKKETKTTGCVGKQLTCNAKSGSKLNSLSVRIMENWYSKNMEHPYPNTNTCQVFAESGNITVEQVKKWFANRRLRNRNTKSLAAIAHRRRHPLAGLKDLQGLCDSLSEMKQEDRHTSISS